MTEHRYKPTATRALRELQAAGLHVEPRGKAWRIAGRIGRHVVDMTVADLPAASVELLPTRHSAK